MSDMDTRDIAMMRDTYGIGERGERLGGNDYPVDGPTTMCPVCSEELPEPDGECADPECAAWARHRRNRRAGRAICSEDRTASALTQEHVATIADAERIAEREAKRAISEAREAVKRAANVLRPAAASPLFGNGLHKGLSDAVSALGSQDEALARLERAVHTYFHGGEE